MLPTFIVIGAMKAGTTALYHYLRVHPQVFMSEPKELDFFADRANWPKGRAWYEGHFAAAGDAVARGEASPNYTKVHARPEVAGRIAEMIPAARLVYLMRHPVERMRSMYLHQVADGQERRPIGMAFASDRDYLRTSMYGMQVAAYQMHFPPEQLLLMQSEALRDDRETALRRIHEFIGVDPGVLPANVADEPNRAADRRIPNLAGALLGRSDAYLRLRERRPAVSRASNRLLTRGVKDAAVPADVEAGIREQLAPDLDRLAKWMPPDFDRWGL